MAAALREPAVRLQNPVRNLAAASEDEDSSNAVETTNSLPAVAAVYRSG